MITINYQGRLGNNMIQYFAGRILAEKHNIKLETLPSNLGENWGEYFKINPLMQDNPRIGYMPLTIDDNNLLYYFDNFANDNIHFQLNGYYQFKSFLHTYQSYIRGCMNLNYEHIDNKDVLVHYRIGDWCGNRAVVPKEYYEEALDSIYFKKGYITSDSLDHPFVNYLTDKFKLEKINLQPLDKINYCKNFNQLILGEGSFSFWIGFLSNAEIVYYNDREAKWFGHDMFHFEHWKKLSWDYAEECLPPSSVFGQLRCFTAIKK